MGDSSHWSTWGSSRPYTVGIEEEVMLLDPAADWCLAQRIGDVLPRLSDAVRDHVTPETHSSAIELATAPHRTVAGAVDELTGLREALASDLEAMQLKPAASATHPTAVWQEIKIADDERHQEVYESMRELARREPTFALHVHIGVADPDAAITLHNRMRGHLALLLGLSANSPFWQGRDSGLASARTPIFGAFPRVGIPSRFADYEEYVDRVDVLLRAGAFPEATFLWWDVRPQPRFGTVEVRVMDVQTRCAATSALAALVQSIARLELEEGYLDDASLDHPELLAENRFIASRDGIRAELIDPTHGTKVPLRRLLDDLLHAARPHADALGCRDSLESVNALVQENGAAEQLRLARQHNGDLAAIVSELAMSFCT